MKAIRIVNRGTVHRSMNCGHPAVGLETWRRRAKGALTYGGRNYMLKFC